MTDECTSLQFLDDIVHNFQLFFCLFFFVFLLSKFHIQNASCPARETFIYKVFFFLRNVQSNTIVPFYVVKRKIFFFFVRFLLFFSFHFLFCSLFLKINNIYWVFFSLSANISNPLKQCLKQVKKKKIVRLSSKKSEGDK